MAFTNAAGKFYICETPQPDDLEQEDYEALVWVEVANVGSLPESGTTTNIVSYDTLDTEVTSKAKGISDAGEGELEVAFAAEDPGQVALRTAALTKFYYATKRELTDAPSAGFTNTIFYNRGLVTGPAHAGGRNEDFVIETYTFGNVQREIVVAPEALSVPANTLRPSISGIATQGQVLTAVEGQWTNRPTHYTYSWEGDGTPISGATSKTYTLVVGDVGDAITVVVTAYNAAGNASAESGATADVVGL